MSTATLPKPSPTIVARTPAQLRGCLHGLTVMERRGWLTNPRRVKGRISEQLMAREGDAEPAEPLTPTQPVTDDEGTQLSEEELRDRNLSPSPAKKEVL